MLDPAVYVKAFLKSRELMILVDCDYHIIDVNETAANNLGYTKAEMISMSITALFYNKKEGEEFINELCKRWHILNWEYTFKTQKGKPFYVMVSGDRIDDKADLYLLVAQNITEIKKETEAKLKQNQLLYTKNMMRLFVHEMKNLSNNIWLAIHELKENDGEIHKITDFIQQNNQKMDTMIQSLLQQDQVFSLDLKEWDVNEVLEEAIGSNQEKIKLLGITLTKDLMPEKFLFPMDKGKVLLALNNIIGNAIESIKRANGIIWISSQMAKHKSIIRISDNGEGIGKEEAKNVFKPYFTTKNGGNGLGLYTSKQILFEHRIGFHIESEKHVGTTFTLYFDRDGLD
ncbi:sensor histidine kinase [Negadavirga shengliensis]|uniref:histidine kinase n=1 Tax=Negadavirga shengliensis TaxID=1389218 RepID=A0ABV9SY66_9BACT